MEILCPKHHIPMQIERVEFNLIGTSAYVAACPQCDRKYIDQHIFKSTSSFTTSGIRYEFLPELEQATKPLRKKEEEEAERIRREEEILKKQFDSYEKEKRKAGKKITKLKQAETRRIQHEEEILKRQFDAYEKKKKKAEKKKNELRRAASLRPLIKDREIALLQELYSRNSDKAYHAALVSYYTNPSLANCPIDNEPLLHLRNIYYHDYGPVEGLCCLRCSRLYLPKNASSLIQKHAVTQLPSEAIIEEKNTKKSSNPCVQPDSKKVLNTAGTSEAPPKTLPSSTILQATIRSSKNRLSRTITIVSDVKQENQTNGCYWSGRVLPSMIVAAIQTNVQKRFVYQGVEYTVTNMLCFQKSLKYTAAISRFTQARKPQVVYLYAHKSISHFQRSNYECVTAMVPCARSPYPVPITVYYEKYKNRYFINSTIYESIREKYGLPYLRLQYLHEDNEKHFYGTTMRPQSELNLLGYRVSESAGLSMMQRQKLLSDIIDNAILTKAEIMSHIEWLIKAHHHTPRMMDAVNKWRADLSFVSCYHANCQRSIYASQFQIK